ncbi:UDP-GlcNAc:betaGal beta-1,3-N-acetylglucosaminyltransferase 7-like [Discoglossus pictus]
MNKLDCLDAGPHHCTQNKEYGDILQWDFNEGHHNLSLKERCFLEWLHYNVPHVAFTFKGDDDEFVNPFNIVQYIKQHGLSPKMLHGALHRHSAVMRYSKYQISTKLFSHAKYPYFLSGGGFLFPGTSVRLLFEASKKLPVFPLDDVYFGFLALAANLTYRHDSRFYAFGLKYDACSYQRALVVHRIHSELLLKIWDELKSASCK